MNIFMNIIKRPVFIFTIILLILILLRLPMALVPFFNIDEGIFCSFANTILNGGLPYRDVVDTLAPLNSYFFAFIFLIFGRNNMLAVHIALIVLILGISIVLYFVNSLVGIRMSGYWAALFFCIFSYNYYEPDMLAFETEWLLAFFAALGAYFLLKYFLNNKRFNLILSGSCFALAVFSKQPALFAYTPVLLFSLLFSYVNNKKMAASIKACALNLLGFSLVAGGFVFYFYVNGAFKDFWYWFWEYFCVYYVPALTGVEKIKTALTFKDSFFQINYLLLALFVFYTLIVSVNSFRQLRKKRSLERGALIDWYLILWGCVAYVAVSYSGRNFGHYYIMVLPPLCLIAGRAVIYAGEVINSVVTDYAGKYYLAPFYQKAIKLILPVVLVCSLLDPMELFYHRLRLWSIFSKKLDQEALIPEEFYAIPRYIKANSAEGDSIVVWGFAPEYYALSGRMSATRFIYSNYLTGLIPWTNCRYDIDTSMAIVPGAWDIFMQEIEKNKPIYILDTSPTNYRCYAKYAPEKFPVFAAYLKKNYTVEKLFHMKKAGWDFRLFRRISGPGSGIGSPPKDAQS